MSKIVGLDLNIDQDYLAQAVKQTVMIGISEALNGKNEIVSQLVNSILTTKVDENGKISSYDSYNKYTLIDVYVKNLLRDEIKTVVKEIIEDQRSEVQEVIRKAINKTKFRNGVVEAVMNGMIQQIGSDYNTKINVDITKKERDY